MVGNGARFEERDQVVVMAATEDRCRQNILWRKCFKRSEAIDLQCFITGVRLGKCIAQLTARFSVGAKNSTKKFSRVEFGKCRKWERVASNFL